ncbi:MAG: hypothetical protein C5B51_16965 [Terriglobia bacterium]|nr:MAG: hypothetical protein C5B51_16965 [Terriglobia bacterium]
MTQWPLLIGGAGLLLVSCGRQPHSYPVPAQRSLDLGVDPGGIASFISMGDPVADDYIVRDISRERGVYRWCMAHPELRFRVTHSADIRFTAELALPEVTFKVTGPVTISYAVDGKPLGVVRCDHAGKYQVSKPVPGGWVEPNQYVHVTFEADRKWISPDDGAQLSFLLFNAGFAP